MREARRQTAESSAVVCRDDDRYVRDHGVWLRGDVLDASVVVTVAMELQFTERRCRGSSADEVADAPAPSHASSTASVGHAIAACPIRPGRRLHAAHPAADGNERIAREKAP
jgi:hypothetical protein